MERKLQRSGGKMKRNAERRPKGKRKEQGNRVERKINFRKKRQEKKRGSKGQWELFWLARAGIFPKSS
jgi:hypothetical protein